MQLMVQHELDKELVLPINYHYILQSAIYHAMEHGDADTRKIHDEGYQYQKRRYRLFQFSLLKGRYRIENKKIIFSNEISFEIRSIDGKLIQVLKEYFKEHGITYGEQHYDGLNTQMVDKTIEQSDLIIKMRTPITVHTTDKVTKKTYFFRPDQDRFQELINANFKRKYDSYAGMIPTEDIQIGPLDFSEKDKYVTKYKNFYISGWYGTYRLRGNRKYLDFLYQVGLGDRNSQGFGMFDTKE